MTLKADTPISRPARCARGLLALLGALLLADALVLMGIGHFNVGVVLPAMLGAGAFGLSWKWRSVQHWRASRPLNQRLWSLGWVVLALWLISLFWFWSRLSGLGLAPQQVPPVQSIVVLGSGTLDGHPRPVLAARLDQAAQLAKLQPQGAGHGTGSGTDGQGPGHNGQQGWIRGDDELQRGECAFGETGHAWGIVATDTISSDMKRHA